jgi:hypothetical protein
MKNLTILFSSFKRALENCPNIKVIDCKSQFDPPSESRKKAGLAELREAGYEVEDWLGAAITLSKGNSMTYHVIRNRQNRGEGSFNLNNPQEFLAEPEPWIVKQAATDADRHLLQHVRVIDQPSVAQTFTGVVVDTNCLPLLPQKLVYCRRGHVFPLRLSLQQYYETLPEFMGLLNWQLLFTEAHPKSPNVATDFEHLQAGLEDFKEIFPGRDFQLWETKLKEKGILGAIK